jgi:hypothetical protein
MQRHFSNRGEALAEVAAAKMRAGRKPPTGKFLSARTPAWPAAPGRGQSPIEPVRPPKPATTQEAGAKVKPVADLPEL